MLNVKKNGFTLAEVVIACSIFAIVVVGIILAINRSFAFMNNTKLSVRAANFSREGVEMVYNIRDTNWRIHSGERDKYWLNLGQKTKGDESNSFSPGVYVIKEGKEENGNSYLYAEDLKVQDANIEDFYSNDGFWKDNYEKLREKSKLTFDGKYAYYEQDEEGENKLKEGDINDVLIGNGLEFYRIVRVFGVYKKNENGSSIRCENNCLANGTPAEMRFCVKVFYRSANLKHSTELCSIMTNFME